MKKLNFSFLVLFMVTTVISCASSKTPNTEGEKLALKEVIESRSYKIGVDMAFPRRGRSVSLTSSYSVEVRNDSVFSYLPYYGRAYSIPYGGGNGLNFKAPIQDYSVKYNKKGTAEIKFNSRTSEDFYKYTLHIFTNGTADIDVVMQQRESIRFSGRLDR